MNMPHWWPDACAHRAAKRVGAVFAFEDEPMTPLEAAVLAERERCLKETLLRLKDCMEPSLYEQLSEAMLGVRVGVGKRIAPTAVERARCTKIAADCAERAKLRGDSVGWSVANAIEGAIRGEGQS